MKSRYVSPPAALEWSPRAGDRETRTAEGKVGADEERRKRQDRTISGDG